MCLSKITKKYKRGNKITDTGFVVLQHDPKLENQYIGCYPDGTSYKMGQKSECNNKPDGKTDLDNKYKPGFHIFIKLKDALEYSTHFGSIQRKTIVKVSYTELIVSGFTKFWLSHPFAGPVYLKTVVAKYRVILTELED